MVSSIKKEQEMVIISKSDLLDRIEIHLKENNVVNNTEEIHWVEDLFEELLDVGLITTRYVGYKEGVFLFKMARSFPLCDLYEDKENETEKDIEYVKGIFRSISGALRDVIRDEFGVNVSNSKEWTIKTVDDDAVYLLPSSSHKIRSLGRNLSLDSIAPKRSEVVWR